MEFIGILSVSDCEWGEGGEEEVGKSPRRKIERAYIELVKKRIVNENKSKSCNLIPFSFLFSFCSTLFNRSDIIR